MAAPIDTSFWDYPCYYVANHDGDTVRVIVDQGFGNLKDIQDGLRLKDVFAPELHQEGGMDTRDFVAKWFRDHEANSIEDIITGFALWPFILRTEMTKHNSRERMSFGRYIGTIWSSNDPITLNEAINAYVISKGYPRGIGFKP